MAARRYDPERRQRIIDAAIRVVGRSGIAGLSHRTVAAEADVPLGSTTYHFASLDELLIAALRQTNEGFAAVLRERGALSGPIGELAGRLAAALGTWIDGGGADAGGGRRASAELECELYLAAVRRPALRPVAVEWSKEFEEPLSARTDPATARAVVALMDGICVQTLLREVPFDEDGAREMLGRLLGA
ncbi:TetR/AcrR family transcriptional regulator [Streptomyces sp. NPDC007088]|uniref:TetR/AcrR family transcriptional regulator n=1 Tax=Streptomyces sp. NPDC007088 TaxID=3364773 RepID=UPI0036A5A565